MSYFIGAATTTVSTTGTVSILAANATERESVRVGCVDAGIWVHILGGTASVSGADCIHIPQNESERFDLPTGHNGLTALREDATDAEVWVAKLGG